MRPSALSLVIVCSTIFACGDDDGSTPARDTGPPAEDAGVPSDADADARDAAAAPDADLDASIARDAEVPLDAAAADAATPVDGATSDASEQPVDPATGLIGVWEVVAFEDSGGPRMAVPPGQHYVFDATTVRISCDAPTGLPYELVPGPAGRTVIHVDLGGSADDWLIDELTRTTFVFAEGGDRFFHERRDACP